MNFNITNKLLKYVQANISILNMNISNNYEQNRNDLTKKFHTKSR